MMSDLEIWLAFYIVTFSKGLYIESIDWGFAFGIALKRLGLPICNCFFCIVQVETSTHYFIQCLNCSLDLGYIQGSVRCVTLLFDANTMGVWTIYSKLKLKQKLISCLYMMYSVNVFTLYLSNYQTIEIDLSVIFCSQDKHIHQELCLFLLMHSRNWLLHLPYPNDSLINPFISSSFSCTLEFRSTSS